MKKILDLVSEYAKFSNEHAKKRRNDFLEYLHQLDEDFFKRKSKHLKSRDKRLRSLWLPNLGVITFIRRWYYDTKKKKYIFLLDKYLNIPVNSLILKEHMKLALLFYSDISSYSKLVNMVFDGWISKMSICRYIKKSDLEISFKNYKCTNDGILYINVDGLWLNTWKNKKKVESKNFSFYTGKKEISNKRYKLQGRNILSIINKPTAEVYRQVEEVLDYYDDIREIRVIGDGAMWIKRLAKS